MCELTKTRRVVEVKLRYTIYLSKTNHFVNQCVSDVLKMLINPMQHRCILLNQTHVLM